MQWLTGSGLRRFVGWLSLAVYGRKVYCHGANISLELKKLWESLLSNNILTLPDQKNSSIIVARDDKTWPLNQATKEKIIEATRGDLVIVEIYGKQGYRDYGYFAPSKIYKSCISNNFKCTEHELMNNI